jgi:hypothetical protein
MHQISALSRGYREINVNNQVFKREAGGAHFLGLSDF